MSPFLWLNLSACKILISCNLTTASIKLVRQLDYKFFSSTSPSQLFNVDYPVNSAILYFVCLSLSSPGKFKPSRLDVGLYESDIFL